MPIERASDSMAASSEPRPIKRWISPARRVAVLILAIVGTGAQASAANGDVVGAGPDETISQAFGPLVPYASYSGAFASPGDVDYLAFPVASAGESLYFAVSNTMQICASPDGDSCPVYATLMDQTNQQVGGDASTAGTVATVGDTETIVWTFAQPGTYYLLMESNGNLGDGQPTYTVAMAAPTTTTGPGGTGGSGGSGGSGGTHGGAGSGPIVKSITVARRQRGNKVRARVVLAQPAARLSATLFALDPHGRRTYVAGLTRHAVSAGTYPLALEVSGFYRRELRRHHRLSLLLKTIVTPTTGRPISYLRQVTLTL
ncbi:MAG TPA: hypothetical protein VG294_18770 [Solirubrobacteraceae bacterium]|jgi:hypothetical protein|nr:hypothetical protein [Solirubrobacteraceae bacterium]